jgi:hypothetical protein
MRPFPVRLSTPAAVLLLLVAACGDDDTPSTPTDATDTGIGGSDTTPDTDEPGPDTSEPTPDIIEPPTDTVEPTPDTTAPDTTEPGPDTIDTDGGTDTDAVDEDATETDTTDPVACEDEDRRTIADDLIVRVEAVAPGDVTREALDDGSFRIVIDASQGGPANVATLSFLYVDLASGEKVDISDIEAATSTDWDLGFERAKILLNSGDSGPGRWLAARVEAESYEAIAAPASDSDAWIDDTFITDTCEPLTIGRGDPATAFGVWYDYDMTTHTLGVPENTGWVLYDTGTRTAWRLEIEDWDAGTYTLRYGPLAPRR